MFNNKELEMLFQLDYTIQQSSKWYDYHREHILLARKYALLLNRKLGYNLSERKLSIIALSHDILKELKGDNLPEEIKWNGIDVPLDDNRYVRTNLDILEEFGLDEYFNTSIQFHPLAAGIFLYKEVGIKDREILYPVMFHTCPILSVYKSLPKHIQNMVDIMVLSDKLSSNYLKINKRGKEVSTDLDLLTFGKNGNEFNYSLGLYTAKLIGLGGSTEKEGEKMLNYYYERLVEVNPLIVNNPSIKKLGGEKVWPQRESQVWHRQ